MWWSRNTLALIALAATAFSRRVQIPPPDLDPFYASPSGYGREAPGTILRARNISASFLSYDRADAWQLLYRTTAVNGTPIAGVTTIFKPSENATTDRFVSFHTAYDSGSSSCDPSYDYQRGRKNTTDLITSYEELFLQVFLKKGFIVSAPDYEGPEAAFSVGRLEGMAVLDSMRAVGNFAEILGLSTKTPAVVGYGYSGGAIATGWAASLQPLYAPELPVKGWAAGGTPSNLTGTTLHLDGTAFSGFLPAALAGLSKPSAYGNLVAPVIAKYGTAKGKSIVAVAAQTCANQDIFAFPFQSIFKPEFSTLGDRVLYQPDVAYVLSLNTMAAFRNETPTAPVYMYHSTHDEIIPYADANKTRAVWCHEGGNVDFVTLASGGHLTTEITHFAETYKWIVAAFDGPASARAGCSASTVDKPTMDPLALGLDVEPIFIALLGMLDVIGRNL